MGGKEAMFDAISKSFPTAPKRTTKELPKETEKLPVSQPPSPSMRDTGVNPTPPENLPMTDVAYEQEFSEYSPELEQLRSDEGFRNDVYLDTEGNLTVGTGHKLKGAELQKYKEGDVIPNEELDEVFEKDYEEALAGAERLAPEGAPDEVKNILTNMVFQMGATGVSKFKNMRAALEEGDYATASEEMLDSKWAQQTPNRAKRLAERMAALSNIARNDL